MWWKLPVPDQSRVDLDARGLQCGPVPVDAGPAAQHRGRSADHGDPPVTELEQMPCRREPAGPVRRADGRDVGVGQLGGRVDQYVRHVCIGEDALVQGREFGSDDDGSEPPGRDQTDWTTDASRTD